MGKGKNNDGALACCAACGACAICCVVLILVIGLIGIGIAKIVMGAIYLHDCELERLIPIFLIVSGVAPIMMSPFSRRGSGEDGEQQEQNPIVACCGFIGFCFTLAWQICGSIWIYPNYGKRFADDFVACTGNITTNCLPDCDADLMKFAFAMVTIDWIFTGLWIVVVLCTCCAIIRAKMG